MFDGCVTPYPGALQICVAVLRDVTVLAYSQMRGPRSNRRPSAFQAEFRLTPMCFSWSDWANDRHLGKLEYLARRFGPILAP